MGCEPGESTDDEFAVRSLQMSSDTLNKMFHFHLQNCLLLKLKYNIVLFNTRI